MAIAITVRTDTGELIGQCCASCYDADSRTKCRCICRGAHHGVGRLEAMASSRKLALQFSNAKAHPEANQELIPGLIGGDE